MLILAGSSSTSTQGDWARVDATAEEEIAAQIAEDNDAAMRDAALYARRKSRSRSTPTLADHGPGRAVAGEDRDFGWKADGSSRVPA
jgi:hypothetical protein